MPAAAADPAAGDWAAASSRAAAAARAVNRFINLLTYLTLQICLGGLKLLVFRCVDVREIRALGHDDVGLNALVLDVPPVRRDVALRRNLQRSAVRHREDALHHALAEGLRADERGQFIIL